MEGESPPQLRKIKPHSGEQSLSLPDEIIEEILSRLPVKSLLKFRCVSKSWRSLIGSKRFIKSHLKNSVENSSSAHRRIIFDTGTTRYRLKQCSLHSVLNEPYIDSFPYDVADSINVQWDSICLVGCCNGLVCILLDRKYFVLWNPSTRMSRKLPDVEHELNHRCIMKHGFGYDELNDDYKIFGITSWFSSGFRRYNQAPVKVYSLKTNSWRLIEERDNYPYDGGSKFVSGKLHWEGGYGRSRDIISFDLTTEVYGVIELPSYRKGEVYPRVGVLGGCLSMLCFHRELYVDVWLMKEYGMKESWDKVVTVSYVHNPFINKIPTPSAIGPNGEIILLSGATLVVYYPKDNVFRHPQITNHAWISELGICVESLVSLVPEGK